MFGRLPVCSGVFGRPHRVAAEHHERPDTLRQPTAVVSLSKTRPGMRECAPGSDPGKNEPHRMFVRR
ncbi:conserved hypothetical protein [Xanthomonas phaseoli pv. phaseoli]|uniref:Secreted protein n=1 Tax=Xanthomonas campestris pv. phaseoli TaxID=317013 RepID=A0AB38DYF1_XANCH|nr:conserved hypothetical protein [Xanthomonas phaseoli pv. phaseoli]SON82022.1 conserved hypothetical protein [Xanthomonas phaseoli pv. phaseoli]SON86321.1 conserved hypothetical protein [Xanthomonas phaseoli pv. phaseoli]SOO32457.1 conserved hypothetical protein [Xanthomonas phaseoli pv. phaseoli]